MNLGFMFSVLTVSLTGISALVFQTGPASRIAFGRDIASVGVPSPLESAFRDRHSARTERRVSKRVMKARPIEAKASDDFIVSVQRSVENIGGRGQFVNEVIVEEIK
jgi:hypothetical protein